MAITPYDPNAEDNSNADTYGSVAGLRSYAEKRGRTVPTEDGDCEVLLINAMDYLEAQRELYQGRKTSETQTLQFPRCGVYIDNACTEFDNTKIPPLLINAQYELACTIADGTSLYPVSSGSFVKSEKVDVIEVSYSETINTSGLPSIPAVDALLQPLFNTSSVTLRTERV